RDVLVLRRAGRPRRRRRDDGAHARAARARRGDVRLLPRRLRGAGARIAHAVTAAGQPARPVILVVDDEALVLQQLAPDLEGRFGRDYRILTAPSSSAALELLDGLAADGAEPAVVLVDADLAGTGGLELLGRVHAQYPLARRVLLVERNYRATSPSVRAM